jgi:hypothetical protein
MVKENWVPFGQNNPQRETLHFIENLKWIKGKAKLWPFHKRQNEDQEVK